MSKRILKTIFLSTFFLLASLFLYQKVEAAEITGVVWYDVDMNGTREEFEEGFENVNIELYDDVSGLFVDTQVTDEFGYYEFLNLPAGEYYLAFNPMSPLELVAMYIGVDPTVDSDFDPLTNETDLFILAVDEYADFVDAGAFMTGFGCVGSDVNVIKGVIFDDENANHVQDASEPYFANISIDLYNDQGLHMGTEVTDASGYFEFPVMPSDQYHLEFSLPSEYTDYYVNVPGLYMGDFVLPTDENGVTDLFMLHICPIPDFGVAAHAPQAQPAEEEESGEEGGNSTVLSTSNQPELASTGDDISVYLLISMIFMVGFYVVLSKVVEWLRSD